MLEFFGSGISGALDWAETLRTYVDLNHKWLQTAVLSAFAALNSVRVLAYVPQFFKAVRDTNGASAISRTTWGLFLASHVTTVFYALICIGDPLMALIFTGNAFACSAILIAAHLKRRGHRRLLGSPPAE